MYRQNSEKSIKGEGGGGRLPAAPPPPSGYATDIINAPDYTFDVSFISFFFQLGKLTSAVAVFQ